MSWGHAVSKDLIQWEELPVAIAEGDDGAIFSGSAVSIGDEIVAFYTRHTETNQSQCIARSSDNGRTFVKFENNPVLDENKKILEIQKYLSTRIIGLCAPSNRGTTKYLFINP